jgi:hypothetical protein
MQNYFKTLLNDRVSVVSMFIFLFGTSLTVILPSLLVYFQAFGLSAANEIGDAVGGLSNPIVSFLGVVTTFLAFFIQYKANERQTNELENQKKAQVFRELLSEIHRIKEDLRMLTYTKENITYSFSEAIWYFMIDQTEKKKEEKSSFTALSPFYYQLSYLLTLFEPLIDEIEDAKIETKEKTRAFSELEALFSSTLDLVLKITDKAEDAEMNRTVKAKIVVPCKKIKIILKDKLRKYKESEKDMFTLNVLSLKVAGFVRSYKLVGNKGTIIFYKSYEDYFASKPIVVMPETSFLGFFAGKEKIHRFLITEGVRLLGKMYFLDRLIVQIPHGNDTFTADLERVEVENFIQMDLEELIIDKEMWRDKFVGRYVFDPEFHEEFIKKFIKKT